jgi:hypothetical protein
MYSLIKYLNFGYPIAQWKKLKATIEPASLASEATMVKACSCVKESTSIPRWSLGG